MSYMLKAMWTEEREEYFESLDEAVAAARTMQEEHEGASVYVEGYGVQVGVFPLPKGAEV